MDSASFTSAWTTCSLHSADSFPTESNQRHHRWGRLSLHRDKTGMCLGHPRLIRHASFGLQRQLYSNQDRKGHLHRLNVARRLFLGRDLLTWSTQNGSLSEEKKVAILRWRQP